MILGCLKIGEKELKEKIIIIIIHGQTRASDHVLGHLQHTELTAAEFTFGILQRNFKLFYFLGR
jgi:hypothetical protein